jgi:ADP-ribose pyrophosphatase YjhB (NUDIX family)
MAAKAGKSPCSRLSDTVCGAWLMHSDNDRASATITIKSRRQIAGNSKFNIFLDHVVDARGNEVLDYLAVEPRRHGPDWVTGVCTLPVAGGRIGLVGVCRHPLGRRSWEAPKGFIEDNESRQQGALRELAEETGLACQPEALRPLGVVAPEAGVVKGRIALFAALDCIGKPRSAGDDLGLETARFFEPDEIEHLITSGEIEDATTLVAYYRYLAGPGSVR